MPRTGVKRIVIEVPEDLRIPPRELEERLRIELALRLYEKGIANLGPSPQNSWHLEVGIPRTPSQGRYTDTL